MPDPVIPQTPNLPSRLSPVPSAPSASTSTSSPRGEASLGGSVPIELGPVTPPVSPPTTGPAVPLVTPPPPPSPILQSQTPPPSNSAGTFDVPPPAVDVSADLSAGRSSVASAKEEASAKADPTALAGPAASLSETPSTSVMPLAETISPPPVVPAEPEQKKKSGGKTSAAIGGLFLLILLPVLTFYVTQKTNVMSNLPFATNKSEGMEYRRDTGEGGHSIKVGAPAAVATGPQNSGVTHTCNGTSQTIGDFVISNCPVSQDCTGSPYVYTVTAAKASNLKLTYVTRSTHCSNVSIQIKVDGVVKKTTGFLGTSQSTGAMDLGTIAVGSHTVALGAVGQTGGCNAGRLASWGGSITTLCGEVAVTPTATATPTSTPTSTPTPTSGPFVPGVCDASCDNDAGCTSGFVCSTVQGIKRCRKPECPEFFTCVCPAVTATPIPTSKPVVIVVTAKPTSTPIIIAATPTPISIVITATPTPKVPVSGVPSVLGASTIVGGILLLLLGLLL